MRRRVKVTSIHGDKVDAHYVRIFDEIAVAKIFLYCRYCWHVGSLLEAVRGSGAILTQNDTMPISADAPARCRGCDTVMFTASQLQALRVVAASTGKVSDMVSALKDMQR